MKLCINLWSSCFWLVQFDTVSEWKRFMWCTLSKLNLSPEPACHTQTDETLSAFNDQLLWLQGLNTVSYTYSKNICFCLSVKADSWSGCALCLRGSCACLISVNAKTEMIVFAADRRKYNLWHYEGSQFYNNQINEERSAVMEEVLRSFTSVKVVISQKTLIQNSMCNMHIKYQK